MLWDELQANCQKAAAKLQEACEVRLCQRRSRPVGAPGLCPSCLPHILPQGLRLRRSVQELESWLGPMEVELRAPLRGQDQPGLDELLEAQGELEASVDRQTRRAQALVGQTRAFIQEGHCLAQDVEEQAQRLLQR